MPFVTELYKQTSELLYDLEKNIENESSEVWNKLTTMLQKLKSIFQNPVVQYFIVSVPSTIGSIISGAWDSPEIADHSDLSDVEYLNIFIILDFSFILEQIIFAFL